jgi:putative cardiolipin synthase
LKLPRKLACSLLLAALAGCASLPSLENRPATTAIRDTGDTRLGKAIAPLAARNGARPAEPDAYLKPGRPVRAGLYALSGGREALAARVVLADAAERSLDIQYYIWRNDRSGTFMFDAIRRAADRGVRVRLLLDDNGTAGQDSILWALDRHPLIEVRLFNPFVQRNARLIGYLTDFSRLNRRMHNKSFTADNQATIIGGRNIGDEYFDATDDRAFADLDVLAVGAIVDQVSTTFDRYWSSESAFPVDRLLQPSSEEEVSGLLERVAQAPAGPGYLEYTEAVQKTVFLRDLFEGRLGLEWAETRMVSDDPGKVLGKTPPPAPLPERMDKLFGQPRQVLELVSPYFVPLQEGVDYLVGLARSGVQVRVLTNSLAATDVVAVHAGYARWRKDLLAAGVSIHEYKPLAPTPKSGAEADSRSARRTERAAGGIGRDRAGGLAGSMGGSGIWRRGGAYGGSGSSLHAKTFTVDRSRVVIGSFNFDPRSLNLNTELGFVIDSAAIASAVDDAYTRNVPLTAWQVTLTAEGDLQWTEQLDGVVVRHDEEPGAGFWRRAGAAAISLLPIDWLL